MVVVNFKLEGELEKLVERYIKAGYAASKTEVLREALKGFKFRMQGKDDEGHGWYTLSQKSLKKIWDNPKDDEVWNKY
ncbi:hypothetical protein FJZ26_04630 [Candidatus Parvarchaeota archaeon]|nr:hypothetical protein [Candidatus Parvarchaeota archaeon]